MTDDQELKDGKQVEVIEGKPSVKPADDSVKAEQERKAADVLVGAETAGKAINRYDELRVAYTDGLDSDSIHSKILDLDELEGEKALAIKLGSLVDKFKKIDLDRVVESVVDVSIAFSKRYEVSFLDHSVMRNVTMRPYDKFTLEDIKNILVDSNCIFKEDVDELKRVLSVEKVSNERGIIDKLYIKYFDGKGRGQVLSDLFY